jgi:hypothetical protein
MYVCEKSSSQTLGGDKTQIRTSFTLKKDIFFFLIENNQSMQLLTDAFLPITKRKKNILFTPTSSMIKDPICIAH